MTRLPHRPRDAARIVGPGRVLVVYLTRLVEVDRVKCALAGSHGGGYPTVYGAGEYESAVVVRVLPYQVNAAWSACDELGFLAELLPVRPCRLLLCLSQARRLLVTL